MAAADAAQFEWSIWNSRIQHKRRRVYQPSAVQSVDGLVSVAAAKSSNISLCEVTVFTLSYNYTKQQNLLILYGLEILEGFDSKVAQKADVTSSV